MVKQIDTRKPIALTLEPSSTEAEIVQNIYCILKTTLGSVPHLRDYGLDSDPLHRPIPIARTAYTSALVNAISLYEQRAHVQHVSFDTDPNDSSHLYPIVEVEILE